MIRKALPAPCASISYLFADRPLTERFAAAAKTGFAGVEFALPYEATPESLSAARQDARLPVVLFTAPIGDFLREGEGDAAHPDRRPEFEASLVQALEYAEALDSTYVQILAGRCLRDDPGARADYLDTLRSNLQFAAERFAPLGTQVVLEAVNDRAFPGFLLNTPDALWQFIDTCEQDVGAVLDTQHLLAMGLDPWQEARHRGQQYAHVQVADGPPRVAPRPPTFDVTAFQQLLAAQGYGGWLGAEYADADGSASHYWVRHSR